MSSPLATAQPGRFRTVLGHHPTGVALVTDPGEEPDGESVQEAGDHWFVPGRVRAPEVRREADPLLFLRGTFRSPS